MTAGTYWLSITDSNNCQLILNELQVGNNCVDNLIYVNQPFHTSNIYQAADFIQSNGVIQVDENVSFKANNYVELSNGFEVAKGGDFEVLIDGCY